MYNDWYINSYTTIPVFYQLRFFKKKKGGNYIITLPSELIILIFFQLEAGELFDY